MKPSDTDAGFTPVGIDVEFASHAEWARLYRLRGIQVVPAFMPGEAFQWKRPLLQTWTEFQEVLVPDEVFLPWYGPGGQYVTRPNMGAITGRASDNLLVIDLDDYKNLGSREWWNDLVERENNRIDPETCEQRTGGGGRQKIFRAPPGWAVPNKTIHSMGIDIKGQGGFVMLPPSMHESGKAYEWSEGQSPDDIPIEMAPDWLLEAVEDLIEQHGGVSSSNGARHQQGPQARYNDFGRQTDGRETKMRDMVWRCVVKWHRQCPIQPNNAESARKAREEYEVYARQVGPRHDVPEGMTAEQQMEREGRGWPVWWSKWQRAFRKWEGRVREDAAKPDPHPEDVSHETGYQDFTAEYAKAEEQAKTTGDIYPFLDVDQIMDKPDPLWAIEELINERSLGFIFGPPGSLKTFIALDLALSMTAKAASWWGHAINRHGAVVYLCREGTASLKFRIRAWEMHRKMAARGTPFFLIEHPTNFMEPTDVGKVAATVSAIMAKAGVPIAALFIDTVSRVLPGAKENQQEDMSLFVGACELLQQEFDCLVIGVHHSNKNGGIRGSTVIPGAGDTMMETRREPGAMTGSIFVHKVKDGEDGYEVFFKVEKVDLGGIVPRSSLMVDPCEAGPEAPGKTGDKDGLPSRAVCVEILATIASEWFKGVPLGKDNSEHPAVRYIMGRWFLKRTPVKRLLEAWMEAGIIEYTQMPGNRKVKGYRKLIDL